MEEAGRYPPTAKTARLLGWLRAQDRGPAWLARKTGYSASYIWKISHGYRPASEMFHRRVARALGWPEDWDRRPPPEDVP